MSAATVVSEAVSKSPLSPPRASTSASSRPPWKSRLSRARYAFPALSLAVVIGLVVSAVASNSRDVGASLRLLSHPRPAFLLLAIGAELLSYLGYASAQRQLADAAGHRLSRRWLAALAIAAQALVNFLPAGYVAGNVLNFRELRRRCLSVAESAWLLGMTSLVYIAVLLALACAGAVIDAHGGWGPRVMGLCGLLGLVIGIVVAVGTGRGSYLAPLSRYLLVALAWMERRKGVAARLAVTSRDVARQMSKSRLRRTGALSVAGLFAVAWLSDCACLACGFETVGLSPPWGSLLVAYAAAQLLSFLPLAPGGFGLVEGGLTVTLTNGDRGVSAVLAAVLVYRALSYWATLPAGGLAYLAMRVGSSRKPESLARRGRVGNS